MIDINPPAAAAAGAGKPARVGAINERAVSVRSVLFLNIIFFLPFEEKICHSTDRSPKPD
jgi:hypothetical protein